MTQTCTCETAAVELPVIGLKLSVPESAFPAAPGGGSGGIDYSLEEQWTGRHWIDGKKLYSKTIDFGKLPNTAAKSVPHNISGLDTVVELKGFAVEGSTGFTLPHASFASSNCVSLYWGTAETILIRTGSNRTAYTAYVTILYTCTDR